MPNRAGTAKMGFFLNKYTHFVFTPGPINYPLVGFAAGLARTSRLITGSGPVARGPWPVARFEPAPPADRRIVPDIATSWQIPHFRGVANQAR